MVKKGPLTVPLEPAQALRTAMALAVFVLGIVALGSGLWTILAREYQQAMKGVASQSSRLNAKALTDLGLGPILDASANLVGAVTTLVRTAMGVGAFLCLIGLVLCLVAIWVVG